MACSKRVCVAVGINEVQQAQLCEPSEPRYLFVVQKGFDSWCERCGREGRHLDRVGTKLVEFRNSRFEVIAAREFPNVP